MANKGAQGPLGATDSSPGPGRFPVGSAQSRAAARTLLERRNAGRKRLNIILSTECDSVSTEPRLGEWREGADGTLIRFCFLPAGMELEEAERIVSQPGWKPAAAAALAKAERARPPLEPEW